MRSRYRTESGRRVARSIAARVGRHCRCDQARVGVGHVAVGFVNFPGTTTYLISLRIAQDANMDLQPLALKISHARSLAQSVYSRALASVRSSVFPVWDGNRSLLRSPQTKWIER